MTNNNPSGVEYLAALTHQNMERIEFAAQQALQAGYEGPTVLLLDLTAPTARRIAAVSERYGTIDNCIAKAEANGVTPVAIWYIPGRIAAALLKELDFAPDDFPPLNDTSRFHVAVVGPGVSAMQTLTLPT